MKFKVFLINLDRSTDRLELCRDELQKYNIEFERVPAVYGKDLSQEEISRVYDENQNKKHYKKPLSLGEIGCYLSHIKCWQKIVDEELDYAIILEDDFKLNESFGDFKTIFEQLTNWDFVRIAFSSRNVPIVERASITEKYDLVHYAKVPINTLAQAVSFTGAEKLLANSQKIFRPVDVDLKHYWEKTIEFMGIDPPLIREQNDFSSEIGKISNGKGRDASSSTLRKIKYASKHMFERAYYNRRRVALSKFIR